MNFLRKKYLWVSIALVGLIFVVTCNVETIGLGTNVDISQPVIDIVTDNGTGPGSFLAGTERLYINATDDVGIESLVVVYKYYYIKDGILYPMEITADAVWSAADNCYILDIDTEKGFYDEVTGTWLPMADGTLSAVVKATDKVGKTTTTPDMIFTVKNNPPQVSMQIPKPKTSNSELLNNSSFLPTVVLDTFLMGVFEDLAGVAPGYPLIKFWEDDGDDNFEPANYKQNAGWSGVNGYNSPGDGWVRTDEGVVESARGEKGGSFKYYLRERKPDGTPFPEGDTDVNNGLSVGDYKLKIKVADINGVTLEWPRDAYTNKPNYMLVNIDAQGMPPRVEILSPPENTLYFNEGFLLSARAEHQGDLAQDIAEMRFEITGNDKKQVLLNKWEGKEITDHAIADFDIEVGRTYYCEMIGGVLQPATVVDSVQQVPGSAYSYITFADGNYSFYIIARDDIGAKKTEIKNIWIDCKPPDTSVVSVAPYYTQDNPSLTATSDNPTNSFNPSKSYRRWTVNKSIKITVTSTDNRGPAIEDLTNYMKFKYLFRKNSDISESAFYAWKGGDPDKTFGQYLYEGVDAKFFDETPDSYLAGVTPNINPLIKIEEDVAGSYTITIQTHKWDSSADAYKLWMYIVAMDQAGNISFDKILLNVDQSTDEPRITFGNINADPSNSTFMDDKYDIRITVLDDNGLSDSSATDKPIIEYRFAKNSVDKKQDSDPNGWYPIYKWNLKPHEGLSEDVLSVNITDLTLNKIARDILNINYSDPMTEAQRTTALGSEKEHKYIQIRATDNAKTKVYLTDGQAIGTSEWREFTMDLTYPEIFPSAKDLSGAVLTTERDAKNPFGIPEKDRAYKDITYVYGDVIEENLKAITIKVDGDAENAITYTIIDAPNSSKLNSIIHPSQPSPIDPTQFYVWKTGITDPKGEILRWHIPRAGSFADISNGSHTFEITFEDKVPQKRTLSLTYYKDTEGPRISFVNPGYVKTMTLTERNNLNTALFNGDKLSGTPLENYNALKVKLIKDSSAMLSGTFNDEYSPVAGVDNNSFWWSINNGAWQEEKIEPSEDKTVNWEVPLKATKDSLAKLGDGIHILSIRVKDALGNGSDINAQGSGGFTNNMAFMVDQSVPKLEITQKPTKALNNEFIVKGKITDTYGVKRFSVKLGNDEIALWADEALTGTPTVSPPNANGKGITVTAIENVGKTFEFTATIHPSGLDDGPASLTFNAVGSSDQSGMTTSSFTVDKKGPSITIGAPISSSIYLPNIGNTETGWAALNNAITTDNFTGISTVAGSTYDRLFNARVKDNSVTFAVTFADDASDVFDADNKTYWYRFDDDTSWSSATVDVGDYGKQSVSVRLSLPAGKRTDGLHRVSIRVKDSLGNGYDNSTGDSAPAESGAGYQSNLTFMLDSGVPVLSEITEDFGITKTPFVISGKITKTFEVQELSVKIGSTVVANISPGSLTRPANTKQTFYFAGVSIDPSQVFTVTDGSQDGTHPVTVTAKGSSEQSAMYVGSFTLDTQGPKISVNAPIKEKKYLEDAELTAITGAILNNNAGSLTTPNKNLFYTLLNNNVKDATSGISGSFSDTYSDVGASYWYRFEDEEIPQWRQGTAIFPNTSNKKSADWQITIPKLSDGLHRVSIRVQDTLSNGYTNNIAAPANGGNGHETELAFILDTGAPVFTDLAADSELTVIDGAEPDVKGLNSFAVKGSIKGTFEIKRLSIALGGPNSTAILSNMNGTLQSPQYGDLFISDLKLTPKTGTGNFFDYSFTAHTVNTVQTTKLAYGARTITVTAVGSSDQTVVKTLPFIFDYQGPNISVSVPSQELILTDLYRVALNTALTSGTLLTPQQQSDYNILTIMSIKDTSTKLTGTFTDDYSPVAVSDKQTFWWSIDGSTWKDETITDFDKKSVGWEISLPTTPAPLNPGVHLLSIRVQDSLGNGSTNNGTNVDTTGGYKYDLAFMLDESIPEIEISTPTPEELKKALKNQFTITGKITNTYGVNRFSVKLGNDEIAVWDETKTPKASYPNGTYGSNLSVWKTSGIGRTFGFNVDINPNGLGDGPATLTYTAAGSSGKVAMVTNSFILDTTGPAITINTTAGEKVILTNAQVTTLTGAYVHNAAWTPYRATLYDTRIKDKSASAKLTGRFSDDYSAIPAAIPTGNKKYTFTYKIDGPGTGGTVASGDIEMTAASADSKSVPWEIPIPTTLADGIYRLTISVKDSLGNGGAATVGDGYETNLAFMIDRVAPVFNVSGITEGEVYSATGTPASFTLGGAVNGTYEIQSLVYSINGGASVTLPYTVNTATTFTINPTTLNASGLAHGRQSIVISAVGSSDQTGTKTFNYIVDNKGPEVELNGREKIKGDELSGGTYTSVTDLNTYLDANAANRINPRTWTDNLAKIYNERLRDNSAKITLNVFDEFSNLTSPLQYRINGEPTGYTNLAFTVGSINATVDIPWSDSSAIVEGLNTLDIIVKDARNNPTTETSIVFMVDRRAPVLSVEGIASNEIYGGSSIQITGVVGGVFDVTRVALILNGNEVAVKGSEISDPLNYNVSKAGFPFDFEIPSASLTTHGTYSVLVNAVGSSGQSKMNSYNIIVDNRGPEIKFLTTNSPVYLNDTELLALHNKTNIGSIPGLNDKNLLLGATSIRDISARLIGNFIDDYSAIFMAGAGNYGYWYKIDRVDGTTTPATIQNGVWTWVDLSNNGIIPTPDSTSAAWDIPLTGDFLLDGYYRVSLRVKDRLDNGYNNSTNIPPNSSTDDSGYGFQRNMGFIIDRGIPILDVAPVPSFISKDYTVTGKITNTGSVSAVEVTRGGTLIASIPGVNGNQVTVTATNAQEFDFSFKIPTAGLSETSYSVMITVTGSSGQKAMEVRNFTFDKTAPTVKFNSPTLGTEKYSGNLANNDKYSIWWSGSWVTSIVKISGIADDKIGVEKIYYHLGRLSNNVADGTTDAERGTAYHAVYQANNNPPVDTSIWTDTRLDTDDPINKWNGGVYYWTFQDDLNLYRTDTSLIEKVAVDPAQTAFGGSMFYLPFYVMVVDRAGNINVVHYKLYVDPDMDNPQVTITAPADNARVGGEVRITGTAYDNQWVHSVDIRIVDTTKTPGTAGYYYKNEEDVFMDNKDPTTTDGWVSAKIVGNTDVAVSWFYNVNADGLLNPVTGMSERHVEVSVRSRDTKDPNHLIPDLTGNPITYNYYFDSGVPTISVPRIIKGTEDRAYTDGIRVSGNFTVRAEVKDDGGISSIRARFSGAYTQIVTNGAALDSLPVGWRVVGTPPTVASGAWQDGYRYYITNPGAVTVSNWQAIDRDWSPGSGKTYGVGTLIKYNGGAITTGTAQAMQANDGPRAQNDTNPNSTNWNSQFFKYTLEFDVNSTNIFAYGKTGLYTLELDVHDNTTPNPYNTRGTFSLGVDNYYPTAEIETQYNATTNNFYVMGKAKDYDGQSGTQQGLARMLIYFQRGTAYYNARYIAAGTGDTFYNGKGYTNGSNVNWSNNGVNLVSYYNVMDRDKKTSLTDYVPNEPDYTTFPYLKMTKTGGNLGDVWESPHAMVIDGMENGMDTDTDGDGTYAEQWDGRVDVIWQARFNTTGFPDGPITVHYIIMDQAGNATHYSDEIYIGNNRPLIRTITLGTDINASSVIDSGEYSNDFIVGDLDNTNKNKEYGYLNTNFRVVRNSRFGLKLDALYGNNAKYYRVYYVNKEVSLKKASEMTKGKVYKIASPDETSADGKGTVGGGDTNWTKYGASNNNYGTTFVASVKDGLITDTSNGYVCEYTEHNTNANTYKTGPFTGDNANTEFTSFSAAPMLDSTGKEYDENNNMTLKQDKLFIVKVFDSTVAVTSGQEFLFANESKQLSHVAVIRVDFDNQDTRLPAAVINPFHWTSASDNSLYENDKLNGHIELEANVGSMPTGYTAGLPKVSGQISIRGMATDNNVIGSLWARMENLTFGGTGVTTETIGGLSYTRITNYTGNVLSGVDQWAANGWKCTITESVIDEKGHKVSYQLDIDTNRHSNVAALNQALRIIARDVSGNTQNQAVSDTQTSTATKTSRYNMDIVPYISNIVTRLSSAWRDDPSAFARSAQGWYSVHEDEVIEIQGFNLLNGTNPSVDIRQAANATAQGTSLYTTAGGTSGITSHSKTKIFARIDNNAVDNEANTSASTNTITSGFLVVRVGAVDSINNNNSSAAYNSEANNSNNLNLTDNRAIYVWNTGFLYSMNPAYVYNPFMRMADNGTRLLSYGYFNGGSSGRVRVAQNNYTIDSSQAFSNRMRYTTIATGGSSGSWYTLGSDQSSNTNRGFAFGRSNPSGNRNGVGDVTRIENGANNRRYAISFITGTENSNSDRYEIPRIAVRPAVTTPGATRTDTLADRVFISYYDAEFGQIKAIYGLVGDTAGANTANGVLNGTRGFYHRDDTAPANVANNNANPPEDIAATVTTITTTTRRVPNNTTVDGTSANVNYTATGKDGGVYTAAGLMMDGRPVLAWYDDANAYLYLSWGSQAPSGTSLTNTSSRWLPDTSEWQNNANPIDSFKGQHVDMAIDAENTVHLAYYDLSGGLWYARIPASGSTPNVTGVTPVRVDTYLSPGTKLMINVRKEGNNYVPYISYYHGTFSGKYAIRIAWRTDFTSATYEGMNASDKFTGKWEAMTIPVTITVTPKKDDFVCNGVPTGTDGWSNPVALTGTGTGDITGNAYHPNGEANATANGISPAPVATLRGFTVNSTNRMDRTVLVGYMTDKWYEGAILKKELW